MADLGYVEGPDFVLEFRSAEGVAERLPALAEELIGLEPDVLIPGRGIALGPLARNTATIPIVEYLTVATLDQYVGHLARPEGNVTGTYRDVATLVAKQLELARDIVLGISRVGYLDATLAVTRVQKLEGVEAAAAAYGWTLITADVTAPEDVAPAFQRLVAEGVDVVTLSGGSDLNASRELITQLAATAGVPLFSWQVGRVEAGALAGYTPDYSELDRSFAGYVVKILEGVVPGDLPIEVFLAYPVNAHDRYM